MAKRNIFLRSIISLFLISSLIACTSPAGISGKIEGVGNEGVMVYLIKPENLQEVSASFFGKVIDSAEINSDGSFEFPNLSQINESELLEIAVQPSGRASNYLVEITDEKQSNYMPLVRQPREDLVVKAKIDEFQESFTIENPSKVNSAMLHLRDIKKRAFETYLQGKHWQVENGSQLLEKEHAILKYQNALIDFANNTEHLLPALVALRWVSPQNDYERVPEFLVYQCSRWKKKQPEHAWVKQLCQRSDPTTLPVLVGDVFPNLKLPLMSKDTVALKDVMGEKMTIIDLWASWCAPCRKENRDFLVPLWKEYHDQGLQIIAYGLETNESAWKTAADRDNANLWLQASDLKGDDAEFLKRIRVKTIPANFILDNKGVVVAKNLHGEALVTFIKTFMKKS